jgi:hypothetical protein
MPYGYLGDYAVLWFIFFSVAANAYCFLRFFPVRRKRTRLIVGNLLICLCVLALAAMIAESYLRFVSVRTDSFGVSLPARRWFALFTRLNTVGCRDVEWRREETPEVRRIAFLGDSFTYGWGIEEEKDRFTNLLQKRFDSRSPGSVEVMNVAFPGWGTGDQLEPAVNIIQLFGVDEIVLCYVFNDAEKLIPRNSDFDPTRPPNPRLFNPDSSCLVDYVYRAIVLPRHPTVRRYHEWLSSAYTDPALWDAHKRQLLGIARACQERGVTFRVVLLPFIRIAGTGFDQRLYHRQFREFLEENRLSCHDLLDVLEGKDGGDLVVNHLDAHPNKDAHRLFADHIWSAFFANGK